MELLIVGMLLIIYSKLQEDNFWKSMYWVVGIVIMALADIILILELIK